MHDSMMNNSYESSSISVPECTLASVVAALEACSNQDFAVRQPAEKALQEWEKTFPGYFSHLLSVLSDSHIVNKEEVRLLAAILIKNAVPTVWCFSQENNRRNRQAVLGSDMGNDDDKERRQMLLEQNKQERAHAKAALPNLYFSEVIDERIAVHLRLAIAAISCFDYPLEWPNLLQDLIQIAASTNHDGTMNRVRAIKAIREVLIHAKSRKIFINPPQSAPPTKGGFLDIAQMMQQAALAQKGGQTNAANAFRPLTLGITQHAASFLNTANELDGVLCVGYIKAVTELYRLISPRMVARLPEFESFKLDSRNFLTQAVQLLEQTCFWNLPYPNLGAQQQPQRQVSHESWARFVDKVYRHVLNCFIAAISTIPLEAASAIPRCIDVVLKSIVGLDDTTIRTLPVKRLVAETLFLRDVLRQPQYCSDEMFANQQQAVQSFLSKITGGSGLPMTMLNPQSQSNNNNNDPDLEAAKASVLRMIKPASDLQNDRATMSVESLVEALVTKFLRLSDDEVAEWDEDPEGRFETDEAERAVDTVDDRPRYCGGMLLVQIMRRNPVSVGRVLINFAQHCQQLPAQDTRGLLHREACYRALQLCKFSILSNSSELNFDFNVWWSGELLSLLRSNITTDQPVPMRMLQSRAVQILQTYSNCIVDEQEYTAAFVAVSHLLAAPDLVTALCAARCVNHLALLHFKSNEVTPQLKTVRENSVVPLGNAFALANRVEGQECLRAVLLLVSGLVEANGTCLERNILNAIAEQLPPLWERASNSVAIHSCLVSVLNHLIGKLGSIALENDHVQKVLFPLMDYCTDVGAGMLRSDTLLEDGLKLWLVTLVTCRMATMENYLAAMLPRLEAILLTGLEAHLSLKVLQLIATLMGPSVLQRLVSVLKPLLMDCVSCVLKEGNVDATNEDQMMSDNLSEETKDHQEKSSKAGLMKDGIGALSFCSDILQMYPEIGLEIGEDVIIEVLRAVVPPSRSRETFPYPLVEAAFVALGQILWHRPNLLEEIFMNCPEEDTRICAMVASWIRMVSNPSVQHIMILSHVSPLMFIDQKRLALSLCAAVCKGPKTRRLVGTTTLRFTKTLTETDIESKIKVEDLVQAACGTTRQVIGDGPLGDASIRTAELFKNDPVLTVTLIDAFERARIIMQEHSPASTILPEEYTC